ncbi:MAG: QcrA and Rieske domain-containing protein [Fimbriimonadaceae bacterium]
MQESSVNRDEVRSRRFFLAGLITFITSFGLVVLGSLRFIVPNVQYGKPLRFKVGMPADFPDNTATYIPEQQIFIVRSGNTYLALSATCTHLGCTVRPNDAKPGFFCPCHGSRFDPNGTNIAGPAPKPLEAYEVSMGNAGELIVDKRTVVSRKDRFQA